ncbi:MAG TPA: SDR family oxidoreductase [Mycobacteriales bacterium]|nr:SDR family oxidoreductase [Mycobacteriales bacterium]
MAPVTIITGGTRGIGATTARRLADSGHDLVLAYRTDESAAQSLQDDIRARGVRCRAVRADVTDAGDVDRLFDQAAEFGPVTGLVNNAGVTALISDLADRPVEVVRQVIDVNLVAALLCARRAIRAMALSRGGRGGAIVNVSSAAATLGSPHEYVDYAAAKAGVEAMTVGLAKELAPEDIRVNAVAPGIVRTRIHADAGQPDRPDAAAARIPMGRAGLADEVAPAIAWLLGPEASYTSGAVLRIAGGL